LSEKDAIISDSLNHASIIDFVCAARYRANMQQGDLRATIDQSKQGSRSFKIIVTDGVFYGCLLLH
jgi:glycine C-acetyltransferase